MATEKTGGGYIVTGKEDISFFCLLSLMYSCRLEAKGIIFRGGSRCAIARRMYNLPGTKKADVVKALENMVEQKKAERTAQK